MIFFYELLFILLAIAALVIGEMWSRLAAAVFLAVWFGATWLGSASFGARLATEGALAEEERRWYMDARDGLRHLRLLLGLATLAALAWRLIAG
ncbi:MAG TPA: hypothetical protein VFG86_03185 [Chloroflexota bacterium]|nr:hypothetical protein [Chloroflexota bacterium]